MGIKIYNSDLTRELREGAKIQLSTDGVPSELADKVIPTMEVNPKLFRISNAFFQGTSSTTSTTASIGTTLTDRDTFINAATLTLQKDVTCDNVTTFLQVVVVGAIRKIIVFDNLSLTATSRELSISFPNPIKLDRGTNIVIGASFGAGALIRGATCIGYTVENINA